MLSPNLDQSAPLYVIGIGPGNPNLLAPLAYQALDRAQTIVGYDRYLKLLPQELLAQKDLVGLGMRQEEERALLAIKSAMAGKITCIVSSGDGGIYAMAGLVIELLERHNCLETIHLEIIPGIPALCAAAALLGAPLMHDFAAISLSDLLTPWDKIKQRLSLAAQADFVIILYNPRSKGRPNYLQEALDIIGQFRHQSCPIGVVREAYRTKQQVAIFDLEHFDPHIVDMLSIVIVGNSETRKVKNFMLTPRGYKLTHRVIGQPKQ